MDQVVGTNAQNAEAVTSQLARESLKRTGGAEVRMAEVPFAASVHIRGSAEMFQPIGSYTLIKGSEDKFVQLLDDTGQPLDVSGKRCALGLSAKDIGDYMAERQLEVISLAANDKAFKRLGDNFCLSAAESEGLRAALTLLDVEKRGSFSRSRVAECGHGIIPTFSADSRILLAPDGGTLIAVGKEDVHQIRIASENGGQLSYTKWERLPRIAANEVSPDHVRKVPGLLGLQADSSAAHIFNRNGGLMVQRIGTSLGIFDPAQSDKPLFSDNARSFAIDPRRKEEIWFVRDNGHEIVKVDTSRMQSARRNLFVRDLPAENVKWVGIEPNGNYLLAVAGRHERNILHVIDRESMKEVASLPNVTHPIEFGCNGNFFYRDAGGKVHEVSANFNSIASGELQNVLEREQEELRELLKAVEDIEVPAVTISPNKTTVQSDEPNRYIKQAADILQRKLGTALNAANDDAALDQVGRQIEELKARQDLAAYPEIFEPIETALAEKRGSLSLDAFSQKLRQGEEALRGGVNVDNSPVLAEQVADLWRARRELTIKDRTLRKGVDNHLKELSSRFESDREELRTKVRATLTTEIAALKELIGEAMSIRELDAMRGEEQVRAFTKLIAVLDDGERREWSKRLSSLEAERKNDLQKDGIEKTREKNARMTVVLERLDEEFAALDSSLKRVSSSSDLIDWQARNAVYKNYRVGLAELPAELKQLREEELQRVIANKEREMTRPAAHDVTVRGSNVHFGKVSFPVFPGYSSVASPRVIPVHPGAANGRLVFEGVGGLQFEPENKVVPINLDHPATAALIKEHREGAIQHFQSRDRRVPKHQNFWVVNEFVSEQLAELAQYFQMARTLGKGIVILEGDAGVGKNILFEMLAHYTNRELFTFACNRKTEKEDLTYAYMYDKERGTYRASSELVQAVQTPGALIIFDEVNTLPVGVSKLLNPLFDHRRSLFMPFGQDIVADASVMFGGAMNPRNYLGTQDLPYEFVDRSLMTQVGYPPEKHADGRFAPFEAEVISQYIGCLRGLKRNEFYRAWNHVVNKENDPSVGRFLDRKQEESLRDLHYIVKLANRLREAYRAYQSGKNSDNEVNLVFSMRGAEWIAAAMNLGMDLKTAVKKVVLPKAANQTERAVLEEIIRNIDLS